MQSAATMESIRSVQNWWHIPWRKLTSSLREAPGIKGKHCQRSNFLSGYRAWILKGFVVIDDIILVYLGFTFPMRIVTLLFFSLKGWKIHGSEFSPFMQKNWAEGKGLNIPQAAKLESLRSLITRGHVGMKLRCFELQSFHNPDSSSSITGLLFQK